MLTVNSEQVRRRARAYGITPLQALRAERAREALRRTYARRPGLLLQVLVDE